MNYRAENIQQIENNIIFDDILDSNMQYLLMKFTLHELMCLFFHTFFFIVEIGMVSQYNFVKNIIIVVISEPNQE